MPTTIKVQYLGVIRLLLSKREDLFEFSHRILLNDLIQTLETQYGQDIAVLLPNQRFVVTFPDDKVTTWLRFPQDQTAVLENGCVIKILHSITGG